MTLTLSYFDLHTRSDYVIMVKYEGPRSLTQCEELLEVQYILYEHNAKNELLVGERKVLLLTLELNK